MEGQEVQAVSEPIDYMALLEPKQQEFVRQYPIDYNGAGAARRAGYSEKAAKEQASRLLTNANVQGALAQIREENNKRVEITIDMKRALLWDTAKYGADLELVTVGGEDGSVFEKQRAPSATVAAIKELNLMDGDHAAKEIDIQQKIGVLVVKEGRSVQDCLASYQQLPDGS